MEICQGLAINTYYSCLDNIQSAESTVYNRIITSTKAVEEEKELIALSDPATNPTYMIVSGDETGIKARMRYVKYIRNGGSKTFKCILVIDPYDDDPILEKNKVCKACAETY
ncbi:unnamed protein product [Euphydryas editha]|uniref:Uncharacterized protein n=1 Tax=Euphydryas editha TaxID=104508 RepID=A0AAU9U998_EUPED|nr:unnamed protein product [Euphydryas editha]